MSILEILIYNYSPRLTHRTSSTFLFLKGTEGMTRPVVSPQQTSHLRKANRQGHPSLSGSIEGMLQATKDYCVFEVHVYQGFTIGREP